MEDRRRAVEILTEARDALARRLVERVIDSESDLLDEARGESYGGEIETIHDQLAARLANVNSMLAQIHALPERTAVAEGDALGDVHRVSTGGVSYEVPLPTSTVIAEAPATIGAAVADTRTIDPTAPAGFAEFARLIHDGNQTEAALTLAGLLDVEPARAARCAAHFSNRYHATPEFLKQAMGLRRELVAGGVNGPLMLLWECFGLQGPEAVGALQVLRAKLSQGIFPASS
ncbi:MAG: hypothetical protein K1X74_09825 [Pirellulales bacterium]|nr:hypothetical protein [Pirellulales bacterium]